MESQRFRLEEELLAAREELARLEEKAQDREEVSLGEGDPLLVQQQLNLALVRDAESRVEQIEHALERLEAGTYRTCESCGRPIDEARLEALPYTTLCIECARRREEMA